MKMRKILSVLLSALLLIAIIPMSASADTSGYYTYEIANGEATITDVDESISGYVSVPATLGGYPVTSIDKYAFVNCYNLTSISLPEGLVSIASEAFVCCFGLASITVDQNNKNYSNDEYGVLFNKDKTMLIRYPEGNQSTSYTIPEDVTSIGDYAFKYCYNLTSISFPEGLTSIGDYAFSGCDNLTIISFPEGLTSIGNSAFAETAYSNNIENWDNGLLYIGNYLVGIDVKKLSDECIVKEGTKLIAHELFAHSGITSISIPEGITSIGDYAFDSCTNLTSISLPEGLTSVGNSAFTHCISLANINLPDSLTSIGDLAFEHCFSLTNINLPEGLTNVGEQAFDGCSGLASIIIPKGITSISIGVFAWCDALTSISLPEGLTSIEAYAFYDCNVLTDVYFAGTEEQWNEIIIGEYNECLTNATIHFNDGADVTPDDDITIPPTDNCSHICHKTGFLGFFAKIAVFFWRLFGTNPVCGCGAAHY